MPFLGAATALNSPDDFLPLRIFVGILTTAGVALILLFPVLCLEWVTDKILFWRRPGLIRKAAPRLGGEAVTHFPGPQKLELALGDEVLTGHAGDVLRFSPSRYVFDYEWFENLSETLSSLSLGGRGWRRAVHTVAAFEVHPGLPQFHLRPSKSILDRWTEFHPGLFWLLRHLFLPTELRPSRVEFASSPEFSRRYMVSSATFEAEAVKEFFTPDVLNFFEQLDARQKWRVDACCGWLFVRSGGTVFGRRLPFRRRYLVAPGKLSVFVEQASAIAQLLEQHGQFFGPAAETLSKSPGPPEESTAETLSKSPEPPEESTALEGATIRRTDPHYDPWPWSGASVLWGLATVVASAEAGGYLIERGFRDAGELIGYLCWVWGFFAWLAASLRSVKRNNALRALGIRGAGRRAVAIRRTVDVIIVAIIFLALLGFIVELSLTKPLEDSLHPDALRRVAGLREQSWAQPADLQTTNLTVVPVIPHGTAEHSQLKGYDLTVLIRDEGTLPAKIQGELVALDCDGDACTVSGRGRLRIDDFIIPRGRSRELKATVWLDSPKPAQHVRRWELRFAAIP